MKYLICKHRQKVIRMQVNHVSVITGKEKEQRREVSRDIQEKNKKQ